MSRPSRASSRRVHPVSDGLGSWQPLPCEIEANGPNTSIRGTLSFANGRLGLTKLTVTARGDHVTGERLREIPVGEIVRSLAATLIVYVRKEGDVLHVEPLPDEGRLDKKTSDQERLRQTASVYRFALALNEPPTKSVARRFEVSLPTATRWVAQAREAGLLEGV